jgi:hypothetical protein
MSLSVATARLRVYTLLASVAGITGGAAKVHDYFRFIDSEAARDLHCIGTSGKFHFWMVTLADGEPAVQLNAQNGLGDSGINYEKVRYTFNLLGYYAVDDATQSEKVWADQVEAVIAAFRASVHNPGQPKLGDPNVGYASVPQWLEGGYRAFPPGDGGVTCHFARLQVVVRAQA